jgi:hypothetical protein
MEMSVLLKYENFLLLFFFFFLRLRHHKLTMLAQKEIYLNFWTPEYKGVEEA